MIQQKRIKTPKESRISISINQNPIKKADNLRYRPSKYLTKSEVLFFLNWTCPTFNITLFST